MSSVDRISALPDEILTRILSFLPTEKSVSTSILGRRWRSLWAYVPSLVFSYDFTESNNAELIDTIMRLHKANNITTFIVSIFAHNLTFHDDSIESHLETWITTAVQRDVRKIHLDISCMLPTCLFTCKTLVDLTVESCPYFPLCSDIYLPSLKNLCLCRVGYDDGDALNRFLTGCPVLENLILEYDFQFSGRIHISSATITSLMIDVPSIWENNLKYTVKINAPALRYIKVYDSVIDHISFSTETIASLIEARVVLGRKSDMFIDYLCNVKCLDLISRDSKFRFGFDVGSTVNFENKTKPKPEDFAGWLSFPELLKSADNLEVHIVDLCLVHWMNSREYHDSLLSGLRLINFHELRCEELQFELLDSLLESAEMLMRMNIYFKNGVSAESKSEAIQRISSFERGSESCELAFD